MKSAPDLISSHSLAHCSPISRETYSRAESDILITVATRKLVTHEMDLLDPIIALEAGKINADDTDRSARTNNSSNTISEKASMLSDKCQAWMPPPA